LTRSGTRLSPLISTPAAWLAKVTEGLDGVTQTVEPATAKSIKAAEIPVVASYVSPPIEMIAQAVATKFDDRTWPQWGAKLADDVVGRLNSELRQAAFLGESIPKIRKRFEKVAGLSRTSPERLARTSVNAASNRARAAIFEANKDIVDGYMFIATLDSRVSRICSALDHKVFRLGDPDTPWPPRHPNCRSVMVPHFDDIENLGERAAQGGDVPATTDFETFLKRQDEAFQKEALGETRWRAWKNGVPMEGFATPSRELTVAELKRLYPKQMAFAA